MTEQPDSTSSELCLEASSEFAVNDLKVTAGFRIGEAEVLAGGPLKVEFFAESDSAVPLYLSVRGDRARLRQACFFFSATVEGKEVNLDDPAAAIPDLGGLGTAVKIERNAPYRRMLLVNEYVRLENLVAALTPGEVIGLRLRCQRSLPLADRLEQALTGRAEGRVADVTLALRVRRDDAALESLIARLAAEIDANRTGAVSAARELAIAELAALRQPAAVPYLRMLEDHPDPVVQMYVQRALVMLNQDH
jgi:hypothetical protein